MHLHTQACTQVHAHVYTHKSDGSWSLLWIYRWSDISFWKEVQCFLWCITLLNVHLNQMLLFQFRSLFFGSSQKGTQSTQQGQNTTVLAADTDEEDWDWCSVCVCVCVHVCVSLCVYTWCMSGKCVCARFTSILLPLNGGSGYENVCGQMFYQMFWLKCTIKCNICGCVSIDCVCVLLQVFRQLRMHEVVMWKCYLAKFNILLADCLVASEPLCVFFFGGRKGVAQDVLSSKESLKLLHS